MKPALSADALAVATRLLDRRWNPALSADALAVATRLLDLRWNRS